MDKEIYWIDEEIIARFYYIGENDLQSDGKIIIELSMYSESSHFSAAKIALPSDTDYGFWRWIIAHPDYRRGANGITEEEIAKARQLFELESSLE